MVVILLIEDVKIVIGKHIEGYRKSIPIPVKDSVVIHKGGAYYIQDNPTQDLDRKEIRVNALDITEQTD